jgi:hypothetical protein
MYLQMPPPATTMLGTIDLDAPEAVALPMGYSISIHVFVMCVQMCKCVLWL